MSDHNSHSERSDIDSDTIGGTVDETECTNESTEDSGSEDSNTRDSCSDDSGASSVSSVSSASSVSGEGVSNREIDLFSASGLAKEVIRRKLSSYVINALYAMNGLFLGLMIYLYIMISRAWILMLFGNVLAGIQVPLIKSMLKKSRHKSGQPSNKNIVSYSLRTALFYVILMLYSVVVNTVVYGDTLLGLVKLVIFGCCPSLFAGFCIVVQSELEHEAHEVHDETDVMTDESESTDSNDSTLSMVMIPNDSEIVMTDMEQSESHDKESES